MRRIFLGFACLLFFAALGCGDESGDPTARITALSADPEEVTPGGNTVITVTVVRPGGAPAATAGGTTTTGTTTTASTASGWGENVSFRLLTANGGQLSTLAQKTDGDGKARTVYTAGNNYREDVIQASLDNGVSASIVIKKTGNVLGASIKIMEPTTPASVKVLGYMTIIATVTDANDTAKPLSGETVEFKLAENNSGATLIVHSAVTDAAGQVVATYHAGSKEPAKDVVQARLLSSGSVSSIVIDVTATASGRSIGVTASPGSVKAYGYSTIQATVTDGGDATKPVSGETVEFRLVANNSGASLIVQNAVTDAAGHAVATYRAGGNASTQDVVQAKVLSNGAAYPVVIDVTAN